MLRQGRERRRDLELLVPTFWLKAPVRNTAIRIKYLCEWFPCR